MEKTSHPTPNRGMAKSVLAKTHEISIENKLSSQKTTGVRRTVSELGHWKCHFEEGSRERVPDVALEIKTRLRSLG